MEKGKRKKHLIRIGSLLLVWAAGPILFHDSSQQTLPEPQQTQETPLQEEEKMQEPVSLLEVSSSTVQQSDTLILRMAKPPITVYFSGQRIYSFPMGEKWLAVNGIGPNAKTGLYSLKASFADGQSAEAQIQVKKRNYPITNLQVTKELEQQGYTPEAIAKNIGQTENQIIQQATSQYTAKPLFDSSFQNPLSSMIDVGAYGNIRKSGTIKLQHLGMDLDAKIGTPVYAINDGKVALQRKLTNYGNILIIDHGLGIYSLYLHLDKFFVQEGQAVQKGQTIATAGNTGYSLDPHLHFSIKVNGASVDPVKFIKTFNAEMRK